MLNHSDEHTQAHGQLPVPGVMLQRENLKDQIASAIRTQILTGRMGPGTLYNAGEIAQMYGASRTPVREAILELASKGLVEVTRGVGFRVVEPSRQDLIDVFAIRELLEVPATAAVAGKMSPEAIATARRLLSDSRDAAVRNDLIDYLAKDRAFHLHLVAQGGNTRLTQIISDLRDLQRVPGLTRLADTGHLVDRHTEHERILEAIEAGRSDEVTELMLQHLNLSREVFSPSVVEG